MIDSLGFYLKVRIVTARSLIGLLVLIVWGELRAEDLRGALLERYEIVFSARQHWEHSVEQDISHLLRDTESYFSDNNITVDDDRQLHQLFKKLSAYWKFFHDNYQHGVLASWNYYRLMFEAIRDVDHNNVTFIEGKNLSYYRLLHDGVRAQMWQALRTYQEHFPFLDWSFCQEITEACPQQQPADRWLNIEQLTESMNRAIDHLNSKIEMLNILMSKGSRIERRLAVRDYIQTYSETIAKPYGMLLFLVADEQHRSMVSAPRLPLLPFTLKKFSSVNHELLQQMFQELQVIFATRLSKLSTLYDKNNKQPLIVFLIEHHQQSVAEFVVNYPQFSAIIDHYLELVNEEKLSGYTINQNKNVSGAALISSASAVFLVSSALFSNDPWRAFTGPKLNILAKVSLVLGSVATYYLSCNPSLRSLCQRPAIIESPRLQRQLQEMSWSLAMRQSNNLRYFLHELSYSEKLKDSASYQKLTIIFYLSLLAVRGITLAKTEDSLLRKKLSRWWSKARNGNRSMNFEYHGKYRKEFDLKEISKLRNTHPEPDNLDLTKRGHLIDEHFSSYSPFGKDFNWEDLTDEQAKELSEVGNLLAEKFSPTDDNIRRLYNCIDEADRPQISEIRGSLENTLRKTKSYIQHLFHINRGDSVIMSL